MRQPIAVTLDVSLAYVEYRSFEQEAEATLRVLREPDETVRAYGRDDGRREEGTGVHVDVNQRDEIVGLEIIDVDDAELVAIARDYAAGNGLGFPDDIRAAAARNPAA